MRPFSETPLGRVLYTVDIPMLGVALNLWPASDTYNFPHIALLLSAKTATPASVPKPITAAGKTSQPEKAATK